MELKLSTAINIVTSTKGRVPVFVCNVLKESSQVAAIDGVVDRKNKEGTVLHLIEG